MREKIANVIIEAVKTIGEDFDIDVLKKPNEETRLFGAKSGVDSVALVTLIAEVEDALADTFDDPIVLADERAMSQSRSPFRRVGTLIDYVIELLDKSE
ncbi:hypothetical protein [Rubellicoccus peritrichatus]|uniref:Carrier domain-containing protein n=1 Tax=Rubellicoccus peritrichatus TaxID=3080537 RepID=A0AAQ3LC26_9BACT|nr:hypothetical protein [Puniceicoccus sp. CR14]WOO42935.1 hypothetical protein RZN69_07505 [Puniceicoccus sp. CR14]